MAEINKLSVEKALQKLCESDSLKSKNARLLQQAAHLFRRASEQCQWRDIWVDCASNGTNVAVSARWADRLIYLKTVSETRPQLTFGGQ
jgi:hypothetical protein